MKAKRPTLYLERWLSPIEVGTHKRKRFPFIRELRDFFNTRFLEK